TRLTLRPLWEAPREIPIVEGEGGHGGGDRRLLDDLFGPPAATSDPLGRAAGHLDGAYAMLVGAAANRSFATEMPVRIADLVDIPQSRRSRLTRLRPSRLLGESTANSPRWLPEG